MIQKEAAYKISNLDALPRLKSAKLKSDTWLGRPPFSSTQSI
jgi:hypothetical protein